MVCEREENSDNSIEQMKLLFKNNKQRSKRINKIPLSEQFKKLHKGAKVIFKAPSKKYLWVAVVLCSIAAASAYWVSNFLTGFVVTVESEPEVAFTSTFEDFSMNVSATSANVSKYVTVNNTGSNSLHYVASVAYEEVDTEDSCEPETDECLVSFGPSDFWLPGKQSQNVTVAVFCKKQSCPRNISVSVNVTQV